MKISVSTIESFESRQYELQFGLRELGSDPGVKLDGAARLNLEVAQMTEGHFMVRGVLRAPCRYECSRCIESFPAEVEIPIAAVFVPEGDFAQITGGSTQDDDAAFWPYAQSQLDLGPMVHEYLALSAPMQPLCSVGCRGLCPHCGANLNEATCSCAGDRVEPRLAPLRKLLPRR
ncbi:MAG: DUF177 domain-containing protein [Candidatus Schekmanbacteria bacterium]|nr:DUF177 domain-containing protein [Candidatus Schekmanbacteria bacterium]